MRTLPRDGRVAASEPLPSLLVLLLTWSRKYASRAVRVPSCVSRNQRRCHRMPPFLLMKLDTEVARRRARAQSHDRPRTKTDDPTRRGGM